MADWSDVAEYLFPHVNKSIDDLKNEYPKRKNNIVSRFAPSPTWFLHIGGLRTAFIAWKWAQQHDGIFILRIEDTDQKRIVTDAIDHIISSMRTFDMPIDEWPLGLDYADIGDYGPYIQSKRKNIYHVFVKQLLSEGKAYPCWMSSDELNSIREQQMKSKITPGIYGNYSVWRNKTPDEIMSKLNTESVPHYGEDVERHYVIRFRSHANTRNTVIFDDLLRGKISMLDNFNDNVILKWMGLPTYHLAHVADDSLMWVSPVMRAEERLTSVPFHVQLFDACWLKLPEYCHLSQVLKIDEETSKKRKLSKRKDPEADVGYYFKNGFAIQWILDYLLAIVDSGFEEWQQTNPDKNYHDFEISIDRMNKAGALFDLQKMKSINNGYLSRISNDELYYQTLERAKMYEPEFAVLIESNSEYTIFALSIERHTEKDPKRFTTFVDVKSQLEFFYDDKFEKLIWKYKSLMSSWSEDYQLPDCLNSALMNKFVPKYLDILDLSMSVEDWFTQLKFIGKEFWFASNNKEFKEWWYVGKIGELAMFFRVALCATKRTPDLLSVMKVMGIDRITDRLKSFLN